MNRKDQVRGSIALCWMVTVLEGNFKRGCATCSVVRGGHVGGIGAKSGESKVTDFDRVVETYQEVIRLDVAMHNRGPAVVKVENARGSLPEQAAFTTAQGVGATRDECKASCKMACCSGRRPWNNGGSAWAWRGECVYLTGDGDLAVPG